MIPPYRLNIVQMMVQFVREIFMLAWMLAMNFNYDVYTVGFKCQTVYNKHIPLYFTASLLKVYEPLKPD